MERFVKQSKPISTWQELQFLYEALKTESRRRWIYRGQREYRWDIASKLERAARRFGEPLERLPAIEDWLLDEFKRHAHRLTVRRRNQETARADKLYILSLRATCGMLSTILLARPTTSDSEGFFSG